MNKPLRQLFFSVICLPVLFACGQEPEVQKSYPRPIKVLQVNLNDGPITRILKAEVQASDNAILSFRVPGEIHELNVKAGKHVKQGDVLAALDPATYQHEVDVAKAEYELAEVLYKRSQQLVAKNFISQNDFDQTKSNFISAKSFLKTQQNRLDYTQLRAPYDGIISMRYVNEYQFVAEKQEAFGFQGKTNVDILFQLPEQYIAPFQLQRNKGALRAELYVRFSGSEEWFKAALKEITTIADSSTASYSVVATLNTPTEFNALAGMAAEVRIKLPADNSLQTKVSEGAILEEEGKQYVFRWVSDKQVVEQVAVTIEEGLIKSGLNDGDWIVAAGVGELSDGQSVVKWVKERGL